MFAFVVAVVVVFAPGWGGGEATARSEGPSDLAAWILAPTVEEASAERLGSPAFAVGSDRTNARALSNSFLLGITGVASTYLGGELLFATVVGLAVVGAGRASSLTAQRAPPRFLTS